MVSAHTGLEVTVGVRVKGKRVVEMALGSIMLPLRSRDIQYLLRDPLNVLTMTDKKSRDENVIATGAPSAVSTGSQRSMVARCSSFLVYTTQLSLALLELPCDPNFSRVLHSHSALRMIAHSLTARLSAQVLG